MFYSGVAVTHPKSPPPSTPACQQGTLSGLASVLLHGVEDAQDVEEEIDNVQVEVDGGQDVFLG